MPAAQDPVKAAPGSGPGRPGVSDHTAATAALDVDAAAARPVAEIEATWGEVATACCVHDAPGWAKIAVGACGALFFLYFFLVALELLGNSAEVLGGCSAGGLLSDETNPVALLVIGALATALVQSSSTTTSIVVTLVGADAVSVNSGIYLVMGANVGTSVTNTIVAMGQMGSDEQLERAFAGATVHDLFNLLAVAVLFPIELATGYLGRLTAAVLPDAVAKGDKWQGPLKRIVSPLAGRVLKANKNVVKEVATRRVDGCAAYYPVTCLDGIEDYKHCAAACDGDAGESFENGDCGRVGLITCDRTTGDCPAFFQAGATQQDDATAGGVCLFLSIVLLLLCLMGLVNVLQRGLMGMSTRVIYKATKVPGVCAIVIGAAITVLVQSSSITTSVLTPIVGLGVIQLEQMFPLTLGANIGTTVTGLLAALVSGKAEALQVALAHLFFNLSGIAIWYPLPCLRRVPLAGARALGRWTRRSRSIPALYVLVVFFVIPLLLLGLSELFQRRKTGYTVLGAFLCAALAAGLARAAWFWQRQDGKQKFLACLDQRRAMSDAKKTLPEDMQYLKFKMELVLEHTGLAAEEDVDEEGGVKIEALMNQEVVSTSESTAG